MDDKWFKQRQKIAGVTAEDIAAELGRDRSVVSRIYTGRQAMSAAQAKVFARVLDVPLAEVMKRAGVLDEDEARELQPGFSDGDAVPFMSKLGSNHSMIGVISAFGGDRPGVDTWIVKGNSMILGGYLPGDRLLVDTHQSETCSAGDVVIAQSYDWQSGGATTLLRRFEPPVLVAASPDPEDGRVLVVDRNNVLIRGKVIASWRN
ncbi:helix-turn-helix domain-containing protein [Cribrihabitans marinus]|nr:XRE family transcriptional regulator [Cribrihabitans marinus]